MNIGFVGLGKLGLPVSLAIESKGHSVAGYDPSGRVHKAIASREMDYQEKGAQELLEKSAIKLLEMNELVGWADIVFVAVQTPHEPEYEGVTRLPAERRGFYYGFLEDAVTAIGSVIPEDRTKPVVVAVISTVLPGTMGKHVKPLFHPLMRLCYTPQYIAMGTTIPDFLNPEYFLLGVDDDEAADVVTSFYRSISPAAVFKTDVKTAELIKVAYNTWISSKICIANTLMEVCEKTGADVDEVYEALSLATRRVFSPSYTRAGMGDGGACHPRDNIALSDLARHIGLSYDWYDAIMQCREAQAEWLADLVRREREIRNLPVVLLGIAFKPGTNIVTGSPAILLSNLLAERYVSHVMYDPHTEHNMMAYDGRCRRDVDADERECAIQLSRPSIFFISTKHPDWLEFDFPSGSVILDPHGYIPNKPGVRVHRIGRRPTR